MIRVLVVDDSAVLRQQLCFILQTDADLHVVGQAKDGNEALAMAKDLKPDVITMDLRMPRMDGFEAIREIMAVSPAPIVVISGEDLDNERELTRQALRMGAVAVLKKPGSVLDPAGRAQADKLIQQVKLMSGVKVVTRLRSMNNAPSPLAAPTAASRGEAPHASAAAPITPVAAPPIEAALPGRKVEILAIGASTGGPAALYKVLSGLPANFPVPVVIVQHISFGFVDGLASWLGGGCKLPVRVPAHGEHLEAGTVYIAPDGHHMEVTPFARVRLTDDAPVGGHRPSVTRLFESVARAFGASTLAVILTGMGADGAVGMKVLKDAGARTIAQDEGTCVVFGMPKEAIAMGAIDSVLPLPQIAPMISALCTVAADTRYALGERKEAL